MDSRRRLPIRIWASLVFGAVIAVSVACGAVQDRSEGHGSGGPTVTGAATAPGKDLLAGVKVVAKRVKPPQPYRRAEFGTPWTDDNDAVGGHNGCDTRNDVLTRDLKKVTFVRTSQCPAAVSTGTLVDPYTGGTIVFARGAKTSAKVQIDHIVPLAYAWDMGGWQWEKGKRVRLANDLRELLAVDGPSNENKKDSPPGRWMPSNEGFHCQYVEQFSFVLREYGLAVDAGSAAVIRQVWKGCR
jgi:hypothetical protein